MVVPNAVTATSEELTAFMIGIPVASIKAGTIRKPPPMPKNPDSVPVARPRPTIAGMGLATGTVSGFFGIGGGFLIVPALMLATGMPIMNAVSSSLVAVTAFGLTTAASYAWSGLVSWALAGLFVAGGIAGGLAGTRSARHLAERRGALNIVFAVVIIAVALYMLARNISLSPA